jgi:hypothetical protein
MLFVQYIPENGQETPKHVGGLPLVISVNNYSAVVGTYIYTHTHIWYEIRYMECKESVEVRVTYDGSQIISGL